MSVPRTLLASLIVIAVGGIALTHATDRFQAFTSETARRIEIRQHPPQIPAVVLQTQSGAYTNLANLRGKWVVADFIYTRCISYCSVLGGEFAQLQELLATPIADGKVQLLSISFDPKHDSPSELTDYLERFRTHGAGWLATRPVSTHGLKTLTHAFGIIVIPDGFGGYVHNTGVEIINPQGRLVQIIDISDPKLVASMVLRDIAP